VKTNINKLERKVLLHKWLIIFKLSVYLELCHSVTKLTREAKGKVDEQQNFIKVFVIIISGVLDNRILAGSDLVTCQFMISYLIG
jgi:hypothetical protein